MTKHILRTCTRILKTPAAACSPSASALTPGGTPTTVGCCAHHVRGGSERLFSPPLAPAVVNATAASSVAIGVTGSVGGGTKLSPIVVRPAVGSTVAESIELPVAVDESLGDVMGCAGDQRRERDRRTVRGDGAIVSPPILKHVVGSKNLQLEARRWGREWDGLKVLASWMESPETWI